MAVIIQIRNDTASNWTSANPVLAVGEMGLETDTRKTKFGDGVTAWNSLSYSAPTDTSELTNGAGYITSSALSDYEQEATIETLDATDSITLADNTIYNGGEQTALTIALPATVDVSFLCEIDFSSGSTPTTLSYPNTLLWDGDDCSSNVFIPVASKRYMCIISYDGVNFRAITKGI